MSVRIAFLRGINVGGKNKIAMGELRQMAARLGFANARTHLQSGNLLFSSSGPSDSELETILEHEALKCFGLSVEFHVRAAERLEEIVRANPYRAEAKSDPSHLVVVFFKSPLESMKCDSLREAIRGRERFEAMGREAIFVYPDGIGDSKLTTSLMDSKLGQRGTGRNWNTVLKLIEMA